MTPRILFLYWTSQTTPMCSQREDGAFPGLERGHQPESQGSSTGLERRRGRRENQVMHGGPEVRVHSTSWFLDSTSSQLKGQRTSPGLCPHRACRDQQPTFCWISLRLPRGVNFDKLGYRLRGKKWFYLCLVPLKTSQLFLGRSLQKSLFWK